MYVYYPILPNSQLILILFQDILVLYDEYYLAHTLKFVSILWYLKKSKPDFCHIVKYMVWTCDIFIGDNVNRCPCMYFE